MKLDIKQNLIIANKFCQSLGALLYQGSTGLFVYYCQLITFTHYGT